MAHTEAIVKNSGSFNKLQILNCFAAGNTKPPTSHLFYSYLEIEATRWMGVHVALFCIQIIKVNFAKTFPPAADRNDASLRGGDDEVKQKTGEGKMPQVIGAEL